jgi:hypothetical protein
VLYKNASFIGCSQANHTGVYNGGSRLSLSSGDVLSTGFMSHLTSGSQGSCHGQGYVRLFHKSFGDDTPQKMQQFSRSSFDCEMECDYYEITLNY